MEQATTHLYSHNCNFHFPLNLNGFIGPLNICAHSTLSFAISGFFVITIIETMLELLMLPNGKEFTTFVDYRNFKRDFHVLRVMCARNAATSDIII